jgi:hypothetical protein
MLFLDAPTLYRVIQRELPTGDPAGRAYPDGSASAYFSTADSYATAQSLEDVYDSASGTYNQMFPASATYRIDDWVQAVFGLMFDSTVSLDTKRGRVLSKLQKIGSLSNWALLTLALTYVPVGTPVRIYHRCPSPGGDYGWQLGISLLGSNTYLGAKTPAQIGIPANVINNLATQWCPFISNLHWRLGADELGVETFLSSIAYLDLAAFQAQAFQYQIQIFNQGQPQLSSETIQALDMDLLANEPARSGHIIVQNLNAAAMGLTVPVPNLTQLDDIDCAYVDPTSTTNYTGLTTM